MAESLLVVLLTLLLGDLLRGEVVLVIDRKLISELLKIVFHTISHILEEGTGQVIALLCWGLFLLFFDCQFLGWSAEAKIKGALRNLELLLHHRYVE